MHFFATVSLLQTFSVNNFIKFHQNVTTHREISWSKNHFSSLTATNSLHVFVYFLMLLLFLFLSLVFLILYYMILVLVKNRVDESTETNIDDLLPTYEEIMQGTDNDTSPPTYEAAANLRLNKYKMSRL